MNKLDMKTVNIMNENIGKIGELFPNVIVESENGKTIDFDLLRQELSDEIVDGVKEKYQLTWPGKKESIINANTPSKNTLRPIREKSVDFDNTQNLYIEGDNLETLKILQESYLNKVKCIYIDPPYNTGNDFIYNDNFNKDKTEELLETGQIDEFGNRLVTNNQSNGRFHSDWLSMMYPRLKLARNLLTDDGIIFISIDDNEQANLKKICDEIFGEFNGIPIFYRVTKKSSNSGNNFSPCIDQVLGYAKNISKLNEFIVPLNDKIRERYNKKDEFLEKRGPYQEVGLFQSALKHGGSSYPIECPDGELVIPPNGLPWRWNQDTFTNGKNEKRIVFKKTNTSPLINIDTMEKSSWNIYTKVYLNEREDSGMHPKNFSDEFQNTLATSELNKINIPFDFAKPTDLVKFLINLIDDKNIVVLDFFSGSATTAHALMQLNAEDNGNRKFIMVQLPEQCNTNSKAFKNGYKNICEIGEERIKRAAKKIKEETDADIDYGFRVYKVDSTNMKDVYYKPSDLKQSQLELFESNIKDDRTNDDLLTQVMLDLGLTLDLKIEEKKILNNNVYCVNNNSLVACFDEDIDINVIDEICKCKPLKVVFKDSSFKYDNDKINLEEKIKKLSPETEISIL